MAKSILDLSHPYFQKSLPQNDAQLMEGLERAKRLIEADHTSCHRVVQPMGGKYPECQNKIWKYDWSPLGTRSSTRKSWRLIAIVPQPNTIPYHIIAAAIYSKSNTDQLTLKQLATIFASVTSPSSRETKVEALDTNFMRVSNGDRKTRSLCGICGESVSVSTVEQELLDGENLHKCAGPPK